MLIRMLGNRFKKIENKVGEIDPNKIVLKHVQDMFYVWDRAVLDESFLDGKLFYYDLGFFKGDREMQREANESRDLCYMYNKKHYKLWHERHKKEEEEKRKLKEIECDDEPGDTEPNDENAFFVLRSKDASPHSRKIKHTAAKKRKLIDEPAVKDENVHAVSEIVKPLAEEHEEASVQEPQSGYDPEIQDFLKRMEKRSAARSLPCGSFD